MTNIKGQKFLTVYGESGTIYEIDYSTPPKLNVMNMTESDIYISADEAFKDNAEGTAGAYIKLPAGSAINGITMPFKSAYIKVETDGNVVIERCG